MYLDFITDIAKIGDRITIKCASGNYTGNIIRLTSEVIAIKDDNGTIIVKADSDIDGGVELINTDINNGTDGRIESDQLSHPNETTGALSKSPVNNCLDLFDSLINNSGVSLDSMTISNGSIIESTTLSLAKDEFAVLLDSGEEVPMKKWSIAGYKQSECADGDRIYVNSSPFSGTMAMTYETLCDTFVRYVGGNRAPVLHSIRHTLNKTPEFQDYTSDLIQLKKFISELGKDTSHNSNVKDTPTISQKECDRLEKYIQEIIAGEDPASPLSDAKIRAGYAAEYGRKYKTKVIREIRDRLGILDKKGRTISLDNQSSSQEAKGVLPTCEINKYFVAYHNGAATSNDYPEIRFLDDVVEPSLLSELQSFHKGSAPIPAICDVSRIGHNYYATFLVKPASVDELKKYSEAYKLASKIEVANALDSYISTLGDTSEHHTQTETSLPDMLAYARKQRLIHNYDVAEKTYLELVDKEFSLDAVVKELADMYREIGKLDTAVSIMEQYLDKMEDMQKAYNFIATLYASANEIEKALEALNKVISGSTLPNQKSKTLYNIALLYIKKSDNINAVHALEEAIKLNPSNKSAKKLLELRKRVDGKKRLEKKVDKLLNFKEDPLIEYDLISNDANEKIILSEETNEHLLIAKQLKNAGLENSDEYKNAIIEYAKLKGIDLIKTGNIFSGKEYLLSAALQETNEQKIESELLYIAAHYPSPHTQLLSDTKKDIKQFFEQVEPIDSEDLFYGILHLIATTKASKRIISALYQSPSWKPWILSYLGVKDLTPTKYVEIIQKRASLEKVCFDEYVSSLNNILKENDIEEIFKSLTQLQPTPFLSEKDTNNISEVKDVADKVIQLRTAYTYDNASDISNAIERKIADIKEGLLLYPTKVSCCHISALLIKISDICSKLMERLVESKEPVVSIDAICDATIDSSGICQVQIQVSNLEGRMKILAGTVSIVRVNNRDLEKQRFSKTLTDTLYGGGIQHFQFELPLTEQEQSSEILSPLTIVFDYDKTDFSKESKIVNLSIRISRPEQFVTIPNPYSEFAHANTVEDDSMFKGREETISEICENIIKGKKCYAIYGQKRSGKSSVLFHIAKRLRNDNKALAVHFSIGENLLGDRDTDESVLNNLYYLFLKEIENGLKRVDRIKFRELFNRGVRWDDIKDNPEAQFRDRLDSIIDAIKDNYSFESSKIILLIDEYTYLYSFIKTKKLSSQFMAKMKALIENNYFTVVVAGHDAMPQFLNDFANEFKIFEPYKLSYIDEKSARELIEDPIRNEDGSSRYQPEAVNKILELSACSPFYIQILCDEIVKYANANRHSPITIIDVNNVLKLLVSNQGSISKGDFENLVSSGDGKLNPTLVAKTYNILQEIAVRTRKIEYCPQKDINVYGRSEDDVIINDLIERDVVVNDKLYVGEKRIKIKVQLYKEWINNNAD